MSSEWSTKCPAMTGATPSRSPSSWRGIDAFLCLQVPPHAPGTSYDAVGERTGNEIKFTRDFYGQRPLRSLDTIRTDILALDRETEGLLNEVLSV